MKLEDQVKQFTDLIVDVVPTVDRLAQNQELLIETTKQNSEATHQMVGQVEKLAIKSTKKFGNV
jgi:succinate dehydrogenase/fumarate reductase-like Fe-S protein